MSPQVVGPLVPQMPQPPGHPHGTGGHVVMAQPCHMPGAPLMAMASGPMPMMQTAMAPAGMTCVDAGSANPMSTLCKQGPVEWVPESQQAALAHILNQVSSQASEVAPTAIPLDSGSTESGGSCNSSCWPQASKRLNTNMESHMDAQLEAAVVAQALAGDISVTAPSIPTQMDRDA